MNNIELDQVGMLQKIKVKIFSIINLLLCTKLLFIIKTVKLKLKVYFVVNCGQQPLLFYNTHFLLLFIIYS